MSTLHQYHWQDFAGFDRGMALIGPADSLVIYGQLTSGASQLLMQDQRLKGIPWYLVNANDDPHMKDHVIDHHKWLDLIIAHDNTCSWKT